MGKGPRGCRGLALLLLFAWQGVGAQTLELRSGPARTVMVELFTSQGCSSCPPAEEFVNGFVDNPRLWQTFIPLAFHVDYWDYLGWKDAYALPANAVRQRRYAQLGHVRGVYTPGFLVNGRGWRPGWSRKEPVGDGQAAGVLNVVAAGDMLDVVYGGEGAAKGRLELHVALLGMGLDTRIGAGENRGRHSRHDFVVLLHHFRPGEGGHWRVPVPSASGRGAARQALVVWVSRPNDPTPLQAAGGYLPGRSR